MNRTILTKQENARYKGERLHILQKKGVCELFILACICADAVTLFSVFDLIITQQPRITWVITITVAAAMNIAPMLLAACLRNEELTKRMKNVLCALLGCLFFSLFVATFSLRYSSQEDLFAGGTNDPLIQSESVIDGEGEFNPTAAQIIVSIILGLEPLATSICSFVLAYEVAPKRKRRHLYDLQKIELEKAIDHDKVMLEELIADMTFDLDDYDQKQFEEAVAIHIQKGELAKNTSIRKLSEHDASPEGVTYLMEGEYMKQSEETVEVAESNGSATESKETNEVTYKRIKSIA